MQYTLHNPLCRFIKRMAAREVDVTQFYAAELVEVKHRKLGLNLAETLRLILRPNSQTASCTGHCACTLHRVIEVEKSHRVYRK